MKITKIQADNFLGLQSINVNLVTPITMFCGPNGAGKSSLQEAIRIAFTRDNVRGVSLKKDFSKLVHEGVKAGGALVGTMDDRGYAFDMPSGTFTGPEIPPAMRIALDGQRFATMSTDDRRTFLFGLTGCKVTPDAVRERMEKRQCDKDKIEAVLPMLRTGFPGACDHAKQKATEAKGAWRTVTGETYGKVKAETWKAEKPVGAASDPSKTKEALAKIDADMAELNQTKGGLEAEARAQGEADHKRAALKEKAGNVQRIADNLEIAKKELAEYEPKVIALRERAKGVARTGLIHDMANALSELINEEQPLGIDRETYRNASGVLERYETEHGPIQETATPDAEAQAALPDHERGLSVLQNRATNLQRDLADAQAAKAAFDALAPESENRRDIASDLNQVQSRLAALKVDREKLQAELRAIEDVQRKIQQADQTTAKAAQHHADVNAWAAVADALAPDGIPGELLAEALEPINKTLKVAATDTGWMQVAIAPDMTITADGREYALLSESEKWRVDAMIAQTVSKVSGLKVLMLDRVDVLDTKGRVTLLTWLDMLAEDGHIETALLFATLKSMPTGLPPTITAYWLENGAIQGTTEIPLAQAA